MSSQMKDLTKMNGTDTPRVLLSMPYSEEFNSLNRLITSSLEEVGIKTILAKRIGMPEDASAPSLLIHRAIRQADVVIVDLTGTDPNMMYEVGYAFGLGKSVLPIVQRKEKRVPADISGRFYLVYDPAEPDKLRNDIKLWTLQYLKESRGEYTKQ